MSARLFRRLNSCDPADATIFWTAEICWSLRRLRRSALDGRSPCRYFSRINALEALPHLIPREDEKMQVLAVLFGSLLLYRVLGATGVALFASWLESARFALATMFVFTGCFSFRSDEEGLDCHGATRPAATGSPCVCHRCPGTGRGWGFALRRHTILGGVRSDSTDDRHASGERERGAPRD